MYVFDVLKERGFIAQLYHEEEIRELMEKEKIGTDEFNALFQEAGPSEQP